MVEGIQAHIGSLNWGYRVALREKKVNYLNAYAEFVDAHTLKVKLFIVSHIDSIFAIVHCTLDDR